MDDPASAVGIATAVVVIFLGPALALFFGGIPSRTDAIWLGSASAATIAVATGEWMLLGQPAPIALFQASVASVALLTVASIGIRAGRRTSLGVALGIWLVAVVVPLGSALFDIEHGPIAVGLGTLDFAGACTLGLIPGTAAIAIALVHRWSDLAIVEPPRRPPGLFVYCAIASVLGFTAVSVGAELIIDDTTTVLVVNAVLAAVGGAMGWTVAQIANVHRATAGGVVAGILAGSVVILAASPWLEPVAVIVLALIASATGHLTTIAFRSRASKQAWAALIGICLIPAVIGLVAAGIVAAGPGLLYSGHADLAESQLQGLGVTLVVSFVMTLAIAAVVYGVGGRFRAFRR